MALYAFDGTCNEWHGENSAENTNVVRFLEYYGHASEENVAVAMLTDDEEYIAGVGTRLGKLGKLFGGFNGAGGHERVREFMRRFEQNWAQGDHVVDVVGFSRGAALALHFSNALSDGVRIAGNTVTPTVRFLGLWDIVPAFGLPGVFIDAFNDINLGWRLGVPANVKNCFHAMALDEDRQAFQVLRPKVEKPASPANAGGTVLQELWFRGVHSDVGGGNGKVGLSSIALHWMLECGRACGLPVDAAKVAGLQTQFTPDAPVYKNSFGGETEHRQPRAGDRFHPTAAQALAIGDTRDLEVESTVKFNVSTVLVEASAEYVFVFDPAATWVDKDIPCTAAGWPDSMPNKPGWLDDIKWAILNSYFFSNFRRVPHANWFELVSCVDYDLKSATPIGRRQYADPGTPWRPAQTGRLTLFANDAESKYDNNEGQMRVSIRRTK